MIGIFLDTETNGLDPLKNRVIEIAYKLVDLLTGDLLEEFSDIIFQTKEVWDGSNLKSLEVNGFKYEDIIDGKSEKEVSELILENFTKHKISNKNAVYICQNPSFDRTFFSQLLEIDLQNSLNWPYHWLDLASMFWALCIEKAKKEKSNLPWDIGFSKDNIANVYGLGKEEMPHRAINGVNHLLLCYEKAVGFPLKS